MFVRLLQLVVFTVALAACNGQPELRPLADGARILAFGDSLTYGTGATQVESYPAVLQQRTGVHVINAGVPGETSLAGLRRLPVLLQRHEPDLVILCHGGNDILRRLDLAETRANLAGMIDLSRGAGAEVVLIGVPRFGLFLNSAPFYSELAEQKAVPVENGVLTDVLKNGSMKSDQIHPNAAGYEMMAQRIHDLLHDTGALPAH